MSISTSLGILDIEYIEQSTCNVLEIDPQIGSVDFDSLDIDDTYNNSIEPQYIESNTKPVIVVLVEGYTDWRSLEIWCESMYQDYKVEFFLTSNREELEDYTRNKTIFENGDITTPGIMSEHIVDDDHIVGYLEEFVYTMLSKNHWLEWIESGRLKHIVHVIDTDGAWINKFCVRLPLHIVDSQPKTRYCLDGIEVDNEWGKDWIVKRNTLKSANVNRLVSQDTLTLNWTPNVQSYEDLPTETIKKIDYKIYYMSCNLEHVTVGKLDVFSTEEKINIAENLENYDCFSSLLPDCLNKYTTSQSRYQASWDFITKKLNSLHRYTNIQLSVENIRPISQTN